jgi:peptidoglycan glycosyltransferase
VQGASVELTIDPVVQKAAWKALGNMKGAVVALDPKTGNILAFVSKPGFDANKLAVHSGVESNANYAEMLANEDGPLLNRAANELYAPGSVFKVIMATAALESGQYTADSVFPNPPKFQLPEQMFLCRTPVKVNAVASQPFQLPTHFVFLATCQWRN